MRNDAFDELDDIPSLRPEHPDRDRRPAGASPARGQGRTVARGGGWGRGLLWALIAALVLALAGLGWWSYRQIMLLEQQLVATQESFARISEEAAGRIQDISGKVIAAESSVTSGSEAFKLQVRQLQERVRQLAEREQALDKSLEDQGRQLSTLQQSLSDGQASTTAVQKALGTLEAGQAAAKEQLADLRTEQQGMSEFDGRIKQLETRGERVDVLEKDIDALRKRDNTETLRSLQQDLVVLRSEVENRDSNDSVTAEFDAFRGQVTRNINTLQTQIQNLQRQLNSK